ncbi:MAG: LytTR family transcriptional regulator [Firmicutes bacterium]|nr:LytTR family transcriptional regulator [Bacillota bacterium]
MQIEVKIDPSCTEPKIVIVTDAMSEDISSLVKKLSEDLDAPKILSGTKNGKLEVLEPEDLIRIYAAAGKVYAVTEKGEYALRLRLYELEERLDKSRFVRISNSEIVNLKKIRNFDLSITGTICVKFLDGTVTYVSRRYVGKIKRILGI